MRNFQKQSSVLNTSPLPVKQAKIQLAKHSVLIMFISIWINVHPNVEQGIELYLAIIPLNTPLNKLVYLLLLLFWIAKFSQNS